MFVIDDFDSVTLPHAGQVYVSTKKPTLMVDTERTEEAVVLRVGRNIKERRSALGLTQAQLAERLGVDTETLSRFERGKHSPTLKNLVRLAGLLQTTVADLLVEKQHKPSEAATIMSAWLAPLGSEDRAFAMAMFKQCCAYLEARSGGRSQATTSEMSSGTGNTEAPPSSEETKAAVRPIRLPVIAKEDLTGAGLPSFEVASVPERLDEIMVLIDAGKKLALVKQGRFLRSVNAQSTFVLYRYHPKLRKIILSKYPDSLSQERADNEELRDIAEEPPLSSLVRTKRGKKAKGKEAEKNPTQEGKRSALADQTEMRATIEYIPDPEYPGEVIPED